ncbi:MAG: 4Fe-4S dicluster domain-containing protein [Streptosporangiales bacterium]|nr:4Fe-4S dicluster domain-containing protein [Streptosporangiales bacterium]
MELINDCVHCGFCLNTCPTYLLWGEEMDSPRGRIYLMKEGLEGEPLTPTMAEHFDRCLGCMACVTSCPSGVAYDRLIEATRAQVERRHPRDRWSRLLRETIFALFPYPRRLRALRGPLRLYQRSGLAAQVRRSGLLDRLSPSLAAMESLAPPLDKLRGVPEFVPARGKRRAVVGMLTGCVQSVFFPEVNRATARVLASEGCDVVVPRSQGCCGALSLHTGREEEAVGFAERTIETFERAGVDAIVVNAAGCGSAMKEYRFLLADTQSSRAEALSAKVRDLSELLVELGPAAERGPLPVRAAYHDACHLSHAQGIRSQPRTLLRGVPELDLREIAEPEVCCGSAGVYNLLQPEAARDLGERKAANVAATGAELLVTANPGCAMQISVALGRRIAVAHVAEVLDASIRGLDPRTLVERG